MSNTKQDRILEALSGLVPDDEAKNKITNLLTSLMDESVAELEKQYDERLEEAFQIISKERAEDWNVAQNGYSQAYEIINDLRNRLSLQKEEFEQTLTDEYEKAYQMIKEERSKNQELEATLHEEYEKKFQGMQEFVVSKVDEYLAQMEEETYEEARRQVLNDPCLAEHRVALEKILEVTHKFMTEEDTMLNTSAKVEELTRQLEQTEVAKRRLESKSMRLMTENNKMQEYLKETREVIEQNMINEQNERLSQARKVEGRGNTVQEPKREVVIGEQVDRIATEVPADSNRQLNIAEQWQVLAGMRDSY